MQHVTINGISCEHLSVMDRGLHYGDGLFETIACVDDKWQFWNEHVQRMREGADRLSIEGGAIEYFKQDVSAMLEKHSIENCVIKLMLTRGQGERGYRIPETQTSTRIVIISDAPEYPEDFMTDGIDVCLCEHPVSKNSTLAGIKHLNRLDNIMARSEWTNDYQEGLMLDDNGYIIEGTMSNIFAVKDGQLMTPSLMHSGVNGIIRDQVISIALEQSIETHIMDLTEEDFSIMDEVFICNSIIGIWPVRFLSVTEYLVGPLTKKISQTLLKRISTQ